MESSPCRPCLGRPRCRWWATSPRCWDTSGRRRTLCGPSGPNCTGSCTGQPGTFVLLSDFSDCWRLFSPLHAKRHLPSCGSEQQPGIDHWLLLEFLRLTFLGYPFCASESVAAVQGEDARADICGGGRPGPSSYCSWAARSAKVTRL